MTKPDEAEREAVAQLFNELGREAPDLTLHPVDRRSWEVLEVIYQVVVFFANAAGAASFVELVRRVVRRRPDLSVGVRYKDPSGAVRSIDVTGESADELAVEVDLDSIDGSMGVQVRVRARRR